MTTAPARPDTARTIHGACTGSRRGRKLAATLSTLAMGLTLLACGDDDTNGEPPGSTPDASAYLVTVVGELSTDDMTEARALHDQIAEAGEEQARAAGDVGHDAMLGTTTLGTVADEFLGIDRWVDPEGMSTFYQNPDIAEAFGALFAAPPTLETFEHQATWHGWGDLAAGDNAPEHYFVVVRGQLAKGADESKAVHDQAAAGGEAAAKQAGDVAHVVFLGLTDPTQFLAIDIWTDATNIEAFYANPDFQAAFAQLFADAPTIGVYRSTDWYQW